jgi:hypothetical protein
LPLELGHPVEKIDDEAQRGVVEAQTGAQAPDPVQGQQLVTVEPQDTFVVTLWFEKAEGDESV